MQTIQTKDTQAVHDLLKQLNWPEATSHKGQNGKLLVIGGSELFHASVIWAAEVASRLVDMVHVVSPAEVNNRLLRERIKQNFLNGIVIPWDRVNDYTTEDDCILIGPGMPRNDGLERGEKPTEDIVNELLARYPQKKWVIDGGALQEVDPVLLNGNMIITPHKKEWERLTTNSIVKFSNEHNNLTILLKGETDTVVRGDEEMQITGGNAGMTKGGTGDVLAGLTAGLATKNELSLAAQAASCINKCAGDRLYQLVNVSYNATDLVREIPQTLQELLR